MKCGCCHKDFEGQSYKIGSLVEICYSCYQKEYYKENNNYQKWQNIKNNMTLYILWVSTGDKNVLQENNMIQYFAERFQNSKFKSYEFNSRKFFEITEFLQLEAYQTSTGKRLKRIDGVPGDILGFDDSNYYLIKKEEFKELLKSLN